MPLQIRKLDADETARIFPRRGQMDLSEYADALRNLTPGDAAEVPLEGLSNRALKRRLGQAAKQLGYALRWAREQRNGVLAFQVREAPTPRAAGVRATRPRRRRNGGVAA